MRRVVQAIYEHGVLTPEEELPLTEGQEVVLVVVSLRDGANDGRLTALETSSPGFLTMAPVDGEQPQMHPDGRSGQEPDTGFDGALTAIRQRRGGVDADHVAADLAAALAETRALPADVVAGLAADLGAALRQHPADAV